MWENYAMLVLSITFRPHFRLFTPSLARSAMNLTAVLKMRMGACDAHYGGNLVDGAKMLQLFGDVATELLIRHDGDEGLFKAYESVEFMAPVHAGDYIEVEGKIIAVGNTSRKMSFVATKYISPRPDLNDSACDLLPEPVIVCKALGTCVVLRDRQRGSEHAGNPT